MNRGIHIAWFRPVARPCRWTPDTEFRTRTLAEEYIASVIALSDKYADPDSRLDGVALPMGQTPHLSPKQREAGEV